MAERNFKITGGLALGDYALTANGLSLLWDSNALATQAYVTNAVAGVTVNTNAIATSLASSSLFVDSGDNLNVNVNAFVNDLDGSGLYVSNNQLAVNANVFAGTGLSGNISNQLVVDTTTIATRAYVDGLVQGLDVKASVRAATTQNELLFTLYDGQSLDGVTLAAGDRILIKNQSTASQNGIYVVQVSGPLQRATDADTTADLNKGAFTFVEAGTANAGKGFVVTAAGTLDTDAITWAQFSETGALTAGNGIFLNGSAITVNVNAIVGDFDGSGLYVSNNQLAVNVNAFVEELDGTGLYFTNVGGGLLAVNVNAIVGDFDGSGLYVSNNQLAVNVNAFAGTGLVGNISNQLQIDQYAAGVRYDGTSGSTTGSSVTTDTKYGMIPTSDTYGNIDVVIDGDKAFTLDIFIHSTSGDKRKSTISGITNSSGIASYTEYGIVDSDTPLEAVDVKLEVLSGSSSTLRAKATWAGPYDLFVVVESKIFDVVQ